MLVVKHLSKSYGKQEVLKDVSFTLEPGMWAMLVGESGCGKSTILKAITKQVDYDGIIQNGFRFTALSQQTSDLFEECTVYENCVMNQSDDVDETTIQTLFEAFELSDCENQLASTLSGGQKQRVSILRALLQRPDVLLLDEPTSQLDDALTKKVMQVLKDFQSKGMAILMVTHDLSLCRYATCVLTLAQGKLTIEIMNEPSLQKVKPSHHSFLWKVLLKRDLWAQKKHYFEMILAISLSIPILFMGLNIGTHYHQDLIHYLANTKEAKEVYVNLAQPFAIDDIESMLEGVDYEYLVIEDHMLDKNGVKRINETEVEASIVGISQPDGANLILSSSLAHSLGLKVGDKVSLALDVLKDFEVIQGFRLQGPMEYRVPSYQTETVSLTLDSINDDEQSVIYLSPRAMQLFKKTSEIAYDSKIAAFKISLHSTDDIKTIETIFKPYVVSRMGVVAIQSDIDALKDGLVGQFAPFRLMSLILLLVLVSTVVMVYKLCRQSYLRQQEILRQLNVSNRRIQRYHVACFSLLFVITSIVSYGIYAFDMALMNALFNPLDYTVLTPRLWPLVRDYPFLMIHVHPLKAFLEVVSLTFVSYLSLYLLTIKNLKR